MRTSSLEWNSRLLIFAACVGPWTSGCEFESPVPPASSLSMEVAGPDIQSESASIGIRVVVEASGGQQLRLSVTDGTLQLDSGAPVTTACLPLSDMAPSFQLFVVPEQVEAVLWGELYAGDDDSCPSGAVLEQELTLVSRSANPSDSTSAEPPLETGDGDGDPSTGDGDPSTGDGDGDPSTGDGDGDGDPNTGDGDGDPNTGDGDGDATT